MATLGGHVTVEDFANISAGSGVHQFCRVGRHAFIGGYSVITKDALPFARTVGSRPARIFGVNTIGLIARGFAPDVIDQAQALVPLPAAVEAEHDERAAADRAGPLARVRRRSSTWSTSSARRSAASSSARAAPARRGSRSPMSSDRCQSCNAPGSHRRQRPLSRSSCSTRRGRPGHDVTVIAIKEEAFPELAGDAAKPPAAALALGVARPARHVHQPPARSAGVTQAVMAGQVKHTKLFADIVPDMTLLGVLMRLKSQEHRRAHRRRRRRPARARHRAASTRRRFLTPLLAGEGVLTRRAPIDEERARSRRSATGGRRHRRPRHRPDRSPSSRQAVVAVEAMEGTDAVIARAGQLAGAGRPRREGRQAESGHALRRAGRRRARRSQAMRAAGATALSVDAGRTLMIDGDADRQRRRRGRHRHRRTRASAKLAIEALSHERLSSREPARSHASAVSPSSASATSGSITPGFWRPCRTSTGRGRRHQPAARRGDRGRVNGTTALFDARDLLGTVDAVIDRRADGAAQRHRAAVPRGRACRRWSRSRWRASLAEADELIAAAARRGVALAVGHTERFNPAVAGGAPAARPIPASSKSIAWARSRSAASTSTSSST